MPARAVGRVSGRGEHGRTKNRFGGQAQAGQGGRRLHATALVLAPPVSGLRSRWRAGREVSLPTASLDGEGKDASRGAGAIGVTVGHAVFPCSRGRLRWQERIAESVDGAREECESPPGVTCSEAAIAMAMLDLHLLSAPYLTESPPISSRGSDAERFGGADVAGGDGGHASVRKRRAHDGAGEGWVGQRAARATRHRCEMRRGRSRD